MCRIMMVFWWNWMLMMGKLFMFFVVSKFRLFMCV